MKCPNCNKEVTDDTKFCPECGHNFSQPQQETPVQQQEQPKPEKKKKKPLWLKIVIGVVCLFVLFSMLGSCSDSSDSSKSSKVKTTSSSSEIEETTATVKSSDKSSSSTPIDIYNKLSKISSIDFTINAKAKTFITEHPNLFPAKSISDCNNYVNYSIEYKHLSKNVENYGDSMVCVNANISEIRELKPEKTGFKDIITEMSLMDDNFNYFLVYYIGSIDLYEGDSVTIYGIPLGMAVGENAMGGTATAATIAASAMTKQVDYSAYKEPLEQLRNDYGSDGEYALCDLNGDGVKELLISTGFDNSDWKVYVYTINNGEFEALNGFDTGASLLYEAPDGTGVYSVYSHMGYMRIDRISYDGVNVNLTTVSETDNGDEEYTGSNQLTMYNINDYSPLG